MTELRRRCLVGFVAITGALAAFAVPAGAAASASAPVQTAWARYTFHSTGSGFLEIDGRVDAAPGAFCAEVAEFDARSPQPQAPFAHVLDLDSLARLGTYGVAGNRDLCPGPVTCFAEGGGLQFSISFGVEGDGHHLQDVREYFVVRGAHVVIHDRMLDRWTASHRAGGVTRRTVSDVTGAGVVAVGQVVGSNLGVTAPGPAGGSIAIAVPGCDQTGGGVLVLSGGPQSQTAICPTDVVAAVAKRATTWNATGAVAGWSNNITRLVVLRA